MIVTKSQSVAQYNHDTQSYQPSCVAQEHHTSFYCRSTEWHSLESILNKAIQDCASDIHIFPAETITNVSFRIEGIITEQGCVGCGLWEKIIVRLKILSHLDIAESRRPQSGSFQYFFHDNAYDIRVSFHPTILGEKVVLRILNQKNLQIPLPTLGYSQETLQSLLFCLRQPTGLILVTGPTGSGKTTTLYALVQELQKKQLNIATLEDPVEYKIPTIHQTQVNEKIGLNYAQGIRSLLRQDPDVILIGEIRDEETAHMCFRAAMTGHLVLSTLHTKCASSSLMRLANLGVHTADIIHNTLAIVSQRLVRKLCKDCDSSGCSQCQNGYRGRVAIEEIITPFYHSPDPSVFADLSQCIHFYGDRKSVV